PEVGEDVAPGSGVTLILATGNVEVPDVTGMDIDEATQELSDVKLNVRQNDQPSGDEDPGTVLDQDRTGPVPRFTTVTLTVATEAEEPTSPPPETESPTEDESPPEDESPTDDESPPDDEEESPSE